MRLRTCSSAGVGQRAGLADRAQEGADALVDAALLEDLVDHGAVLALELARAAVDRNVVDALLDLDAQVALGVGLGGAEDAAGHALELGAPGATREAYRAHDVGDRAHRGVVAVVSRDEQDAIIGARVDGQRDVHGGEDDGVVERNQQKAGH
jgi:hypothetical protein